MNTSWAVFLLVVASAALSHQNTVRGQAPSYDDELVKLPALYPLSHLTKRSVADEGVYQDVGLEDTSLLRTRRSLGILAWIRDRLLQDLKYELMRIADVVQKWLESRIANGNSVFDLLSFTSELNSKYMKVIADIGADSIDEIAQTLIDLGRELTSRLHDFIFNIPPSQRKPMYKTPVVNKD